MEATGIKYIIAARFATSEQSKVAYEAIAAYTKSTVGKEYNVFLRRFASKEGYHVAFLTLIGEPDQALQSAIVSALQQHGGVLVEPSDKIKKMLCTPIQSMPVHKREGNFTEWRSGL